MTFPPLTQNCDGRIESWKLGGGDDVWHARWCVRVSRYIVEIEYDGECGGRKDKI